MFLHAKDCRFWPPSINQSVALAAIDFSHCRSIRPGELAPTRTFTDIREFKRQLLQDERQIARNLDEQLIVYATGTQVSFADPALVERILEETAMSKYGVPSILHAVIQSETFRNR